ncbi:creatininase family protein [Hoeflea poritis]|uniref:Creatininase family protein n=1 Tax=Hoeflea poritis TaxID=2993659 RepID=A0ABT4VJ34_9HYPH|nr:creatininase family protein [Hoeflea poritis]MDA4844729.1 creatininase family protein [Hoeflea poritis]
MRLDLSTWPEVETYLRGSDGIILPTGSTEQHGPIGLIGTDSLCAQDIAEGAAEIAGALVAPVIGYTPAPFNMSFPGTLSVSPETYSVLVGEVLDALVHHGFGHIYILNGHGANLEPLRAVAGSKSAAIRIRNWWDFEPVNVLRREYYGDWEGMHATPSEIAITQHRHRVVLAEDLGPPEKLTPQFIKDHAGDRHGPPDEHRARFPDGRVGSHSALASPEQGRALFDAACAAVAEDYAIFAGKRG